MKDQFKDYAKTTASLAPIFAAKGILGDIPKATLEASIEGKLHAPTSRFVSHIRPGFTGRALGRAMGGIGVGILTAPLLMKGMQMAGSKNPSERKKGLALVGLSSAVYSSGKGFTEGYKETKGIKAVRVLHGGRLALTRLWKVAPAVVTALAITSARKSKDGGTPSTTRKYLLPAISGVGIGAVSRAVDWAGKEGISKLPKGNRLSISGLKALGKGALPAAAGGAAGGLLGGLLLAKLTDVALSKLKTKQSSILIHRPAGSVFSSMCARTKLTSDFAKVGKQLESLITKGSIQ